MTYSVYLKNVQFFAYHGLYPEEALKGNMFEIDLTVNFTRSENIHSIGDTIDYVSLYEILKTQMQQRRDLVETVGREICDRIKNQYPQIISLQIDIRKLQPPISGFNGVVGMSLSQQFIS